MQNLAAFVKHFNQMFSIRALGQTSILLLLCSFSFINNRGESMRLKPFVHMLFAWP